VRTEAEPRLITTGDGSKLSVRPIRPSDRGEFLKAFAHLGDESRYRRFLRPIKRLTEGDVRYFTEVDHREHEALIALTSDGEIVAVGRYIRLKDDPTEAEVAVTVADEWQRQGVGGAILRLLAERARKAGIETFQAICLASNTDMRQLLEDLGRDARTSSPEGGVVEIETRLPTGTSSDAARATALRDAARGHDHATQLRSSRDG
jgi:GNAT superfamily N-acetyltransferase